MTDEERAAHATALAEDGYTIVERAFPDDWRLELLETLDRLEREMGIRPADNGFEGRRTWRIYNLLAHGRCFERIPVDPTILTLVATVLDHQCLVSSLSSIAIGPGETAQPIHADDQVMPLAKPHVATVCNTMWALTDFTEANGATRIIPRTHRADASPVYGQHYESIPAEMPAGSVLIWHGSLWHGGGANHTDHRRVGIAMNYCAGWVRQQENQMLGLPYKLVKRFDPQLQELCGFGIYKGLIGHIDKKTAAETLFAAKHRSAGMLWDRG
jgi:ectoine hydroxylase-related dioxygenase (phytanoyl-CoA dioxygenase family)